MRQFRYGLCRCLWRWDDPLSVGVWLHEGTQLAYFTLYGGAYHLLYFLHYSIIVRQYDVSGVCWSVESEPCAIKKKLSKGHAGVHLYIPLYSLVILTRDTHRDRDRLLVCRLIREWSTKLRHNLSPAQVVNVLPHNHNTLW